MWTCLSANQFYHQLPSTTAPSLLLHLPSSIYCPPTASPSCPIYCSLAADHLHTFPPPPTDHMPHLLPPDDRLPPSTAPSTFDLLIHHLPPSTATSPSDPLADDLPHLLPPVEHLHTSTAPLLTTCPIYCPPLTSCTHLLPLLTTCACLLPLLTSFPSALTSPPHTTLT